MKQIIIALALTMGLSANAQTWQPSAKANTKTKTETKESVQCNGMTQKKAQCKRMVDKTKSKPDKKGHYYCYSHVGQAE